MMEINIERSGRFKAFLDLDILEYPPTKNNNVSLGSCLYLLIYYEQFT